MAAYRLLHPETGRLLWLDPQRHARNVAAWLRHAVGELSMSWPYGASDLIVHGHAAVGAQAAARPYARLSYVPLPSITPRGVGAIGRVIVVGSQGLERHIDWIRPRLAGLELSWQGTARAVLEPLSISQELADGDAVLRSYIRNAYEWTTVTPVVLPGHHGGSPRKAEGLLRKAFVQAGLEPEIVGSIRELEWRDVGFRAGVERAGDFALPDKIRGPRFHVRVRFGMPVVGPLAIGTGRHRGLGIFASSP
jgi:CRISPR-associated protein Csb2